MSTAAVTGIGIPSQRTRARRVERGVGDAGRGVGEPGPQVRHEHTRLAGGARVPVGRVGGRLFVPCRHEPDAALAQRVEQTDDRVAAQTEDHFDAQALEVVGQLIRRDTCACAGGDGISQRMSDGMHRLSLIHISEPTRPY